MSAHVASIVVGVGLAAAACFAHGGEAVQSASKPFRLIVPYPPGGAVDVIARVLSPKLNKSFNQPIVVDNRPGASGIIASEALVNAPADGQTIVIVISSHSVNPALYKKLPYDTLKDFAPVTLIANGPNVLCAHPSLPVRTVKELIRAAKARPHEINYAQFGSGSSSHLSGELFNLLAGVQLTAVPYKGAAPAVTELLGGHVSLMFGNMPVSLPHVKSGRLRALAVTSAKRAPAVPELPTIAESGVPGYEIGEWWGVLAHGKTPPEVVQKLNREIVNALGDGEVRQRLSELGAEIAGSTPQSFDQFIKAQMTKWGDVVRKAGIEAN